MRKIHKTIATVALGLLLSAAQSAKADVQITVGSETYGVTVVSGTFNSLMTQLEAQPEWGNKTLATTIATDVGTQLGLPNLNGKTSPFFAYQIDPTYVDTITAQGLSAGSITTFGVPEANSFTFGILTDEGSATVPDAPSCLTSLCLFLPLLGFGFRKHLLQRRMA